MRKIPVAGLLVILTLGLAACSSTSPEERLVQQLANTDKKTVYEKAEALFAKKKYTQARKLFSFLYDTFPNDPIGHKAALRVADTYYQYNDRTNLTEARLRYRDFANRFPNDPDRDYALLMLGNTYTKRKLHPDRDLNETREAVKAYRQLLNLYPNSKYAPQARKKLAEVRTVLAEHEWQVAHFYARNKMWLATEWRLEYLKEHFPEYPRMAEVNAALAEAKKNYKAHEERIRKEFEKFMAKHKKKEKKKKAREKKD
jgi:outer membrane assembly lipoprotein YfiO